MDKIDLMVAMIDKLTGPAMKMGRSLNQLKARIGSLGTIANKMGSRIAGISAAVQAGFSNSVFGRAVRGVQTFGQGASAAIGITGLRMREGLGRVIGHVRSFGSDFGEALKRSQIGQAASAAFGRLQSAVGPPLKRAGQAIQQFAARAQMNVGLFGLKVRDAASKAGSALAGLAAKAGPHLKNLGQKFLDTAKSAGFMGVVIGGALAAGVTSASVKLADFSQRSNTALEMLTGGVNQGRKAFDLIRKTSEDLGLDIVQTTQDFQKLISVGFGVEQANTLVKMGADMTALGVETGKVTSILDAMGKIQATGSLQGDELMMLAEAGINIGKVYDKLGAKFGKTRAEIVKMKEAGKIASADALEAIQGVTLDTMGTMEFGQARTKVLESSVGGAFDRIKTGAQSAFLDIGERIGPALTTTMGAIGEAFGGRDTFVDSVSRGIIKLLEGVQAAIPYVKAFVGALVEGFSAAWPAIEGALGMLFDGFTDIGGGPMQTVKDLGAILGKVAAFAVGVAVVFGGMVVGAIQLAVVAINGIISAWDWLIAAIGKIAFTIDDFIMGVGAKWERFKTDAIEAAKNLIAGLVNGINEGAQWVIDAVKRMAGNVVLGMKTVLGIASPSKVMEGLGDMTTAGFVNGLAPLDGLNPLDGIEPALPQVPKLEGLNPLGGLALPQNDNGTAFGERPMLGPATGADAGAAAGAAFGAAAGVGGAGSAVTVTIGDIIIEGSGEDAKATAQEVRRILLSELGPAFEELMLETGSG